MEEKFQTAVLHQEDGSLVEEPRTGVFCGGTQEFLQTLWCQNS